MRNFKIARRWRLYSKPKFKSRILVDESFSDSYNGFTKSLVNCIGVPLWPDHCRVPLRLETTCCSIHNFWVPKNNSLEMSNAFSRKNSFTSWMRKPKRSKNNVRVSKRVVERVNDAVFAAGILSGDLLLTLNGQPFREHEEVDRYLEKSSVGDVCINRLVRLRYFCRQVVQ